MEEKVKLQSVPTKEQVLEQTIAADERILMPQGSATPDSNCSAHANFSYFQELAQLNNAMQPEPCFQSIALDTNLMSEIKGLGLAPNQELYVHEIIKQAIQSVKEGLENPVRKIDALVVSRFSTWGQAAIFLSKSVTKQNKYPDIKKYWQPLTELIKTIGENLKCNPY